MKTNLMFKQVKSSGSSSIVVLPIEIPDNLASWTLCGSTNECFFYNESENPVNSSSSPKTVTEEITHVPKKEQIARGDTFNSSVTGTGRLIRKNNVIWIAYRKDNKCSPNTVCISDSIKKNFFNDCRLTIDCSNGYKMYQGDTRYDFWNEFIDNEYERQRVEVNNHA